MTDAELTSHMDDYLTNQMNTAGQLLTQINNVMSSNTSNVVRVYHYKKF